MAFFKRWKKKPPTLAPSRDRDAPKVKRTAKQISEALMGNGEVTAAEIAVCQTDLVKRFNSDWAERLCDLHADPVSVQTGQVGAQPVCIIHFAVFPNRRPHSVAIPISCGEELGRTLQEQCRKARKKIGSRPLSALERGNKPLGL